MGFGGNLLSPSSQSLRADKRSGRSSNGGADQAGQFLAPRVLLVLSSFVRKSCNRMIPQVFRGNVCSLNSSILSFEKECLALVVLVGFGEMRGGEGIPCIMLLSWVPQPMIGQAREFLASVAWVVQVLMTSVKVPGHAGVAMRRARIDGQASSSSVTRFIQKPTYLVDLAE